MVIDENIKKDLVEYFRSRYDFEDRVKDERSGYNDLKKRIADVLKVKPKAINKSYLKWKAKKLSDDTEDISDEIVESVR